MDKQLFLCLWRVCSLGEKDKKYFNHNVTFKKVKRCSKVLAIISLCSCKFAQSVEKVFHLLWT